MKVGLCTNGHEHFVMYYGKKDTPIVSAPLSILKMIIKAKCFEVVHPNGANLLPLIKLRDDYIKYNKMGKKLAELDQQKEFSYSISLCSRQGVLLQYFSKKWKSKLPNISNLVEYFRDKEDYLIGVNYDSRGIQFFIDSENMSNRIKRIQGNFFFYPFLFAELEEDLQYLKSQSDVFRLI